ASRLIAHRMHPYLSGLLSAWRTVTHRLPLGLYINELSCAGNKGCCVCVCVCACVHVCVCVCVCMCVCVCVLHCPTASVNSSNLTTIFREREKKKRLLPHWSGKKRVSRRSPWFVFLTLLH